MSNFITVTNGSKTVRLLGSVVGNNFPYAIEDGENKYLDVTDTSFKTIIQCLRSTEFENKLTGKELEQFKLDAIKIGFTKADMTQTGGTPKVSENISSSNNDGPLKKSAMSLMTGGGWFGFGGSTDNKNSMLDNMTVSTMDEQSSMDEYYVNADSETKKFIKKIANDVNKFGLDAERSSLITNNSVFQKFVDKKMEELDFSEALTETEQHGGFKTKYKLLGGN